MDRRAFLSASAAAAAAPVVVLHSGSSAASLAQAKPEATQMDRLRQAIAGSRMPIDFDGNQFSGAGYDWLVKRGAEAHAFLLGEEHGIAENPKLAAQLFKDLAPAGYRNLAVEISPPMARALDEALLKGPAATRALLTNPKSRLAFFGMREEADFLAAARAAVPRTQRLLWGLDYDVAADRYLIAQLKAASKPAGAETALARLAQASAESWAKYDETHNPQYIFSFAGDPKLVRNLVAAWPGADAHFRLIMDTLEQTLAINAMWGAQKGYESNLLRVRLLRANLLRYWKARHDPDARLFMKFGASHMVRGVSMTDTFDIGSLVPELVAEQGGTSFHLLVLPGPGAQTANLDPTKFVYVPGNRDQYGEGTELFDEAVIPATFTLFDMAELRPIASSHSGAVPLHLWRVIHGFDAVLVMTGSHPSSNL
jgi:hypothetical protein